MKCYQIAEGKKALYQNASRVYLDLMTGRFNLFILTFCQVCQKGAICQGASATLYYIDDEVLVRLTVLKIYDNLETLT